jgi:tyrosine-protein kinase Etk/Wzc
MNTSITTVAGGPTLRPIPPERPDSEDVDFVNFLRTIADARRLILAVTLIALVLGGLYIYFGQPIYQADTLIQVEQSQNNTNSNDSVLSQLNAAFNVQSSTSAEMEILSSRLVIGQAVDALNLTISATPNYLPLIGAWMARRATHLSRPGVFGYGGYVTGTEAIRLGELVVPENLLGKNLTLVATRNGYELFGPNGQALSSGRVGVPSRFAGGSGHILVTELRAEPGAHFTVIRRSRLDTIDSLVKRLNITEKGKPSGVLQVSLQGGDPEAITSILNTVGSAYARQNVDRKAAEAGKSLAFLDNLLPQLKAQVNKSESEYTRFRDQHGTFDLTTEGVISLNASAALQTQLFDLEQKRRELVSQFTDQYPSVHVVDQQIAAVKAQIAKLATRIKNLPDLQQQLVNLTRNVKVSGDLFANLLNSEQQLQLIKEGKVGNVRVVDPAVIPIHPVSPNPPLVLALSATAGILLGVMSALLRNWRHPGIKHVDDIEMNLGLNVFVTIPHSISQARMRPLAGGSARGGQLLALAARDDPAVESLRSLRTTLQFTLQSATNNIVLMSGPTPQVGKTFVSANFSALLGAAGKRVLLIDADFRQGGLHKYFGLDHRNGFSELIDRSIGLQQALHENVVPNVDFIATGSVPSNPSELLLSRSVDALLQELSGRYEVVLLDTAPLLPMSDTLALAPLAGTVFLVARTRVSTLAELQEAARRLHRAGSQIQGVIFNDLAVNSLRYGTTYDGYQKGGRDFKVIGS